MSIKIAVRLADHEPGVTGSVVAHSRLPRLHKVTMDARIDRGPRPRSNSALVWLAVAIVIVLVAATAILSTARTFSGTVDEPAHIGAGVEWLSAHRYDYDLQHPPLGRIAAALGPYLRGAR